MARCMCGAVDCAACSPFGAMADEPRCVACGQPLPDDAAGDTCDGCCCECHEPITGTGAQAVLGRLCEDCDGDRSAMAYERQCAAYHGAGTPQTLAELAEIQRREAT